MSIVLFVMSALVIQPTFADPNSNSIECGLQVNSNTEPNIRIISGYETYYGEFPWVAALHYESTISGLSAGIRCGGFIIAPKYVVTAARCLQLDKLKLNQVWLGVRKISEVDTTDVNSARKIFIETAIPHEHYQATTKLNDIALLRLNKTMKYSVYIRPICLPEETAPVPQSGTRVVIAGWGQPLLHGPMADHKLKVDVPIFRHDVCEEKLGHQIKSTQMCAEGETLEGSCWGDEGGPAMLNAPKGIDKRWVAIGIISAISGCNAGEKPSIYTRVSSFIPWILEKIETS